MEENNQNNQVDILKLIQKYIPNGNNYSYADYSSLSNVVIDGSYDIESLIKDIEQTIHQETAKAKEEQLNEIINDIPLCRDRITKCNCHDHDINEEVFNYLESLQPTNNTKETK